VSVFIIVVVISCANIVPPSGGQKDFNPPQALKQEPENFSINFHSKVIKIVFDEFIQLKNLNQQFMVSPPFKNLPDITVRGKSLMIKLNDTLNENTTYNLYFGNAIVDITESNALSNFQYVFSTSNELDSMYVSGTILNAFDLKPVEDVYVMLYDVFEDSVPYLQKPLYITKTDKSGAFKLNNLKNIPYKIFALNDANNNMLFDLPYEKIAFVDTTITPQYLAGKNNEKDTTATTDTLHTDTTSKKQNLTVTYQMYMFEQTDSTQKILKKNLEKKNLVVVSFKFPVKDFKITYPNLKDKNTIIEEFNTTKDTLKIWLKDLTQDSLFAIIYQKDTVLDTLHLSTTPRASKRATEHKLLITSNLTNNTGFNFFEKPTIEFNTPIAQFINDSVVFMEDSLPIMAEFIFKDSAKRVLQLCNPLKEETSYALYFPPAVFRDIFNGINDSAQFTFKTKKKEDYGTLTLNVIVPHEKHQFIIQMFKSQDKIFEERIINTSQKIEFPFVEPDKFFVKIIFDKNNDNKWNTGNYLKKIQAEKVQFIKQEISSRANWDVEVEIKIED